MKRSLAWVLSLLVVGSLAVYSWADDPAPAAKKAAPDKAAVERSRKTVRMLDEVYKTAVVLITDKYVNDTDDFAAGSAAVALFQGVSKSGHQKVRLIDASGKPYEAANVAKEAFEKEGIKKLKAGAESYDEVVEVDGKYELRAVTPIPVVMDKCIMCHAHYADAKKKGEIIGVISYIIPIE